MQIKTAEFASMVASNDLIVSNRVTLSFADAPQYADVSLGCDGITVERDMTTDTPAGSRLITGYPTGRATVNLSGLLDPYGSPITSPELLNPYNPASPLYRDLLLDTPVVIEAGLWVGDTTPEYATLFTGSIDNYTVDPVAGTVQIECVDDRAKLRSVPAFRWPVADPMPAITTVTGGNSLFPQQTRPGLTSLYVIDALLRANGIYASPPERAGALMSASMVGGAYPQTYNPLALPTFADTSTATQNRGSQEDPTYVGDPMMFVPGYWTPQVPRDSILWASIYPFTNGAAPAVIASGGGWYWQGMVNFTEVLDFGANPGVANGTLSVTVEVNSGNSAAVTDYSDWQIKPLLGPVGLPDGSHTWLLDGAGSGAAGQFTASPGWHQFAVQVTFPSSTSTTYTAYLDGDQVATVTESNTARVAGRTATRLHMESTMPLEVVVLTGETAAVPDSYEAFVPTAFLDRSLNNLRATLSLTGKDPWNVIQELCAAELAVAGFDELNVFRFTNRATLRQGASVRQVRSDTSLKGLGGFQTTSASVANRVVVPINAVTIGEFQAIYQGPDTSTAFYLPGRTHYDNSIKTQTPFLGLSPFIYFGLYPILLDPTHPVPGQFGSGYRSSKKLDGTGAAVTTGVDMTVYQDQPDVAVFNLNNRNSYPVYFVTPTAHGYPAGDVGKPFFFLGAFPIYYGTSSATDGDTPTANTGTGTGAPTGTSVPPANAQYVRNGEREQAIQLPANDWVQDPVCAQSLAEDVLEDLLYPRPVWPAVTMVADPRLQLADRITAADPDASLVNDDAIIFGSSISISPTAWDQSLDCRAVGQPGYWVLGSPGHSELGYTTYI